MATRHQQSGNKLHEARSSEPADQLEDQQGQLVSAREAALWLGVNPRTAQLRARRALKGGDSAVRPIAGAYCAPRWWWQKILAKPIKVGRPPKDDLMINR
jgi:hypothetical protein